MNVVRIVHRNIRLSNFIYNQQTSTTYTVITSMNIELFCSKKFLSRFYLKSYCKERCSRPKFIERKNNS